MKSNNLSVNVHNVAAFVIAMIVYGISAGPTYLRQSLAPHYIHLANAFLKGQTNIEQVGIAMDIIQFSDKLYIPSPPMPAVLLMPFVAAFGATFSDILFSIILGAVNVFLVQKIFQKSWLTLFFAFGTPHWYFSALGSVWFQAQATAILFTLLATLVAKKRQHPLLSGALWGCAVLSRPTVLFGALFPLVFLFNNPKKELKKSLQTLCLFSIPLAISLLVVAAYNVARFDNWRDFGYANMLGAPNIVGAIEQYGTFNLEYLPCNLRTSLFALPVVDNNIPTALIEACDHLVPSGEITLPAKRIQPNPFGMSLFLASPLFLLLFVPGTNKRMYLAIWVCLLAVMLPNWLVHNTGSLQFGYRYWLDATPMWLAILAATYNKGTDVKNIYLLNVFRVLAACSVLINSLGIAWMYKNFVGVDWYEMLRNLF